jgi:MYXO-CTERM domain-containing protein
MPLSIAPRAGGYAVLWGNAENQTSDSERAAVTLTDEEGNVLVSKIIDSPNDAVATAIVSNGAGYLVFVPDALNSTTNERTERTVLQLDTDLNVIASNPTELLVNVVRNDAQRYSDVVVSGGEYYAVYDKQRWQNELAHGPLWFAHLAADGTIADELEVIAETTGNPVLAAADADSFLLTTSASETMFIQRGMQGGDDAGGAGDGDVPASGDGGAPAEVSGGTSAGGIDGAGEVPEDQSSAGAAGGSDAESHAAPPRTSSDSSCRTAGVGAPAGSSWWPTLLALGLVGLARRRR